ncbi:MAG: hypothetical protein JXB07_21460 [Anaerolineae bacterium]|nr:hypothetical protein [Anaerolineae bacterium]
MSAWEDILNAALIGTGRKPFTPPVADGLVGEVLAQIGSADGERNLLASAAVITQWQRAGALPAHDTSPFPEPAPADDRPRCSARAGQHLAIMAGGEHAQALPEWLEALYRSGKQLPEEYLPILLALGVQKSDLREAIVKVIGERGRWLAAINDTWHYAVTSDDEADWETASTSARVLFLRRLRATNPDRARELIEAAWATERADERARYLETLQVNLSMADEPFLEACLDDRSKKVRDIVPVLLARLPQSAYVRRMIERVDNRLILKGNTRLKLEVTLPEKLDEVMIRDGIEEKPPSKMGKKAWWLLQMLKAVPPNYWVEKWGKTPAELIDAAGSSDWKEALCQGWFGAVECYPDSEWVMALLKEYPKNYDLFEGLTPDEQERCVLELSKSKAYQKDTDWIQLIGLVLQSWSIGYAEVVLKRMGDYYKGHKGNPDWHITYAFPATAYYFPPELLDKARRVLLPDENPANLWLTMANSFIDTLEFRRNMLEELQR